MESLPFYEEVYHDMQAPVSSILQYLQFMEHVEGLPVCALDYMVGIKKNTYRIYKMLRDINDSTRMQNGVMAVHFLNAEITATVRGICEEAGVLTLPMRVRVEFQNHMRQKCMAIDRHILSRILFNLITNAGKYSPKGGRIVVALEERRGFVHISVRDFGTGIRSESDVFERYRADKEGAGIGLGLYIVRELTNLLKGEVNINERVKRGTEVCLTLPILLTDEGAEQLPIDDFFYNNIIQMELAL